MKKLTIRINRRLLLFFLLMFPHLKPKSISHISTFFDNIYDAAQVITLVIIALMYFVHKKEPSRISVLTILLGVWVAVVTFANGGDVLEAIKWAGRISAVPLIMDYYYVNLDVIIKGLFLNLEWIIYANLYTVLRYFPNGLYAISKDLGGYFLGNRNSFIEWVFPTIVVSVLFIKNGGNKLRCFSVVAAGIVSIIITGSATSLVMLGTFAIVLFTGIIQGKSVSARIAIFVYIAADLLITKLRSVGESRWFIWLVRDVLNKRTDLSGRQELWQRASRILSGKRLLFGEGYIQTFHPHNQIYQFLVYGGIIVLLLYGWMLFNLIREIDHIRQRYYYVVCVASIAAWLIGSITEGRESSITTFLLLSLCYIIARRQSDLRPTNYEIAIYQRSGKLILRKHEGLL